MAKTLQGTARPHRQDDLEGGEELVLGLVQHGGVGGGAEAHQRRRRLEQEVVEARLGGVLAHLQQHARQQLQRSRRHRCDLRERPQDSRHQQHLQTQTVGTLMIGPDGS